MVKTTMLVIRMTAQQEQQLVEKAHSAGFLRKSEYVRSVLFRKMSIEEKIDKIYQKVCKDG